MVTQKHIAQSVIDAAPLEIPLDQIEGLDAEGLSAIHYVAMSGEIGAAHRLRDAGWSMDLSTADGYSPFEIALDSNHFDFCDHMLADGADVERRVQGVSSLDYASMCDKLDIAQYLVRNGADVNGGKGYRPPLCWAVQENSRNVFEFLLANGAVATASSESKFDDMTALHMAAVDTKISYLRDILATLTLSDIEYVREVQTLATSYEENDALALINAWLVAKSSGQQTPHT